MALPTVLKTSNTLVKVAANLRWLCEKSGVDPELGCPESPSGVVVGISVNTSRDRDLLIETLKKEFDAEVMDRVKDTPGFVRALGIWIGVTVKEKPKPKNPYSKPMESA